MILELSMVDLVEIVLVVLTLKLITTRWKPPLQESLSAIISILIGVGVGFLLNPTKEGIILAVVISSVSFYGRDLINEFTELKSEIGDTNVNLKTKNK